MTTTERQRRPHISVKDVFTKVLGSDHRAVVYQLTVAGRVWYVATYNMGGKATRADVVGLIRQLRGTGHPWTLALQETGDQRGTLAAVVKADPSVELVQGPQGLGRSKLATIVPRGSLMTDGLVKISDRTFVGQQGAGGAFTDHKYVLRTRQRVGGTVLRAGNLHAMSSVDGSPTPWRKLRRMIHGRQITGAVRWAVRGMTSPTVLVGDFNTTPPSPLLNPIRRAGMRIVGMGSHGGKDRDRRAIDLLAHS